MLRIDVSYLHLFGTHSCKFSDGQSTLATIHASSLSCIHEKASSFNVSYVDVEIMFEGLIISMSAGRIQRLNVGVVESFSPSVVIADSSPLTITLFGTDFVDSHAFVCQIGGISMHRTFALTNVVFCVISEPLYGNLSVCVSNDGVAYSCSRFPLQVVARDDSVSVSPSVGSLSGGTLVWVSANRQIYSVICIFGSKFIQEILRLNNSYVCVSPPKNSSFVVPFEVIVDGLSVYTSSFVYLRPPTLASLSPSLFPIELFHSVVTTLFGTELDNYHFEIMFDGNRIVRLIPLLPRSHLTWPPFFLHAVLLKLKLYLLTVMAQHLFMILLHSKPAYRLYCRIMF